MHAHNRNWIAAIAVDVSCRVHGLGFPKGDTNGQNLHSHALFAKHDLGGNSAATLAIK